VPDWRMGWPTSSDCLNVSDLYFAIEGFAAKQRKNNR
jgi:hypothetical protein